MEIKKMFLKFIEIVEQRYTVQFPLLLLLAGQNTLMNICSNFLEIQKIYF